MMRTRNRSVHPVLCVGSIALLLAFGGDAGWAQDGGSAPSNAGNYGRDASISVNPRTAELTLDAELVHLPGITDAMGLSVGLSYSSAEAVSDYESNIRYFGLPYGWKYNVSFIANAGTYQQVHIDGAQTYILDSAWRTMFRPAGSTSSQPIATGMLQYNRADANLRSDNGTVTVNGIVSAYRLSSLDGRTRFFSAAGLLIQDQDRFGNTIRYHYNANTNPQSARLASIIDSWGNTTTFTYCNGGGCEAGQVTITMPDGRTSAFVAPDSTRVTKLVDAAGMVTSLAWGNNPCARGENTLIGMTSASGGMMSIEYTCMNVCTQPSTSSCAASGAVTTWPVVQRIYNCPNNASGVACPAGSPTDDFLTSEYTLGAGSSASNYTGFPRYSPYAPSDPLSDSLMSSNDHTFTYATVVAQKHADGSIAYQTESTYNFLHLLLEEAVSVRASQPGGSMALSLSKETSYCYGLTSSPPAAGCPTPQISYQSLPANYQSVVINGSCVYGVNDASPAGQARVSVVTNAYDSFGQTVNSRSYYGTSTSAVTGTCDRNTRLDPSPLQLVHDDYMAFDTPTVVDSSQHLTLGVGAGHYGIMTAHQTFSYTEPVDDDVHGEVPSEQPILVQLTCSTLDPAGIAVRQATSGMLSASSTPPASLGVIEACNAPSFDDSVAPPKTSEYTYDAAGRVLSRLTRWFDGVTPPPNSVTSTGDQFTYTLTAAQDGEEICGSGDSVLETTAIDGQGNATQSRVCTLNAFPLSTRDALGRVTTYRQDQQGLTTLITHPNGTSVTHEYYYACPLAPPQAGSQPTCPAGSGVLTGCPYDDAAQKRSCVVQTLVAGSDPTTGQPNQSSVDGVLQVSIKDGIGRVVELRDNLGGQEGAGYTAMQTRSTTVYDDLGRTTSASSSIGAAAPLVYTTSTTYDAKQRPSLVCGARGVAQQFAYDDIGQQTLLLHNGTQREQTIANDRRQAVATIDCPIVPGSTTASGGCPSVASSTTSATCSGEGYYSYSLHDGSGLEHSRVAGGANDANASVASIQGLPLYAADYLQYQYSAVSSTGASETSTAVTTASSWTRDVQGMPLTMQMSVTDPSNNTTTFTSDAYTYNNIGQTLSERNKLSDEGDVVLQETYTYNANRLPVTITNYAGTTFYTRYDNMDRKTRFCHAAAEGGSEGETMTYDPITGAMLSITHFVNPEACESCQDDVCPGDVATDSITYTYTRFGQMASKVYSDGTRLSWAYDAYQRPSCFADAEASLAGHECPESPTPAGFAPSADQLLTWYTYWPDDDPYRRGLPMSACRGVRDGLGGYAVKCLDADYYTSDDTGGSCDAALASVTGAFAGMAKTSSLCTGGSCLDGSGTLVHRTTHFYDAHARSCSVETRNSHGNLVLGQTYEYDQYNNVVRETSASELDANVDVNYQSAYVYDGLLRLISETRSDVAGNLIESTTYTYDAASNLIRKVQEIAEEPEPGPTRTSTRVPSSTPLGEDPPTPTQTATAVSTATVPPLTPTQTTTTPAAPTAPATSGGGGCTAGGSDSASLAWLGALALLLPLRRGRWAGWPSRLRGSSSRDGARATRGRRQRLMSLAGTFALVMASGCDDSDSPGAPTHTPVPASATTATEPTATATPTVESAPTGLPTLPTSPAPGPGSGCDSDTDTCTQGHSTLFAIAHSYNDPTTTVLYRVTVPPWSTGGAFGDGTNGFFYQAVIDGHTSETRTYVPFNGIGVDGGGSPELPQFHFIVPVDVSAGFTETMVTIKACAANGAGGGGTAPVCTRTLWSNTYSPLPEPSVGPPPFDFVDLEFLRTNSVTVPNTGVFPGQLTLTASGITTPAQAEWLANHLVFFDDCLEPYTNDIFDDTSHRSLGVLTLTEALYPNQDGSAYVSKYGDLNPVTPATFPSQQYFFYTLDQQGTSQIEVGVQLLYDQSESCPGYINNTGSRAPTCGGFVASASLGGGAESCADLPSVNPQAAVIPQPPSESAQSPPFLSTQVLAGTQEIRTLYFQPGGSTCSRPVNPLAGANGRPNYVIRENSAAGGNFWGRSFPNALYYVVPSGFGNCDLHQAAPFCELSAGYAAYVPQYAATDGSFGPLNGGSTAAPVVGSIELADEYLLPGLAGSSANALIWFDNCGFGYTYEECSSCQQRLGTRKTLPKPPFDYTISSYTVTNDLPGAVVFGKECCASWYQQNQNTQPVTYEPPQMLDDGFGAFIGAGETLDYATIFKSEALAIYDATTGLKRFKLHLGGSASQVYSCTARGGSVNVSGGTIALGADGAEPLACGRVGLCPYGFASAQDGSTVTCTLEVSDFVLGMPEWSEEVAYSTDVLRLMAWGSTGATTSQSQGGGHAGFPGFAATSMAPADLGSDLYAYVAGGNSSASTLLTRGPELSLLTDAQARNVKAPDGAGVLLIAGGGGEGGTNPATGCEGRGGDGGAGAVAIARNGAPVSAAGNRGEDGSGGSGGAGGNGDGQGKSGGTHASPGIGGWGRGATWSHGASLIPPTSWTAGNGGTANPGGDGGGGFGGGDSGYGSGCDGGGGGGGGGSWAAKNTVGDPSMPTSPPASPNGGGGAIQIVYEKNDGPCAAIAIDGQLVIRCIYETSQLPLDFTALAAAIERDLGSSGSTPVYVETWGGSGGDGGNLGFGASGGTGGLGGYTRSVYAMDDLSALLPNGGYLYVGGVGARGENGENGGLPSTPGNGGASTIFAGVSLASIGATNTSRTPRAQNVIAIAGGGGGGGQTLAANPVHDGGAGGDGGQAIAGLDGDASAGGKRGGKGTINAQGGSDGKGGCGVGTFGSACGDDGIGGQGGGGTNWIDAGIGGGWKAGSGGSASSGGGGGGGFGGGEAGPTGDPGLSGGGGAGGGSWALQATTTGRGVYLGPMNPPVTRNGSLVLTFDPCAVTPEIDFCGFTQ